MQHPTPPENERRYEDDGLHWPEWMPGWMRLTCGALWFIGVFGSCFAYLAWGFYRAVSGE